MNSKNALLKLINAALIDNILQPDELHQVADSHTNGHVNGGGFGRQPPSNQPPPQQPVPPPRQWEVIACNGPPHPPYTPPVAVPYVDPSATPVGYPAPGGGVFPVSPQAMDPHNPQQVYQGTLKSFSMDNGFGFIHNEDLRIRYGSDVFLHKNQHNEYVNKFGPIYPQTPVAFRLEENSKGKPQARDLRPAGYVE